MVKADKKINSILPNLIINIKDINIGMILVSTYILIEIGSFRVFSIVDQLQLPYLVSVLTFVYAIYLVLRGKFDFKSPLNKMLLVFCIYIIVYAQIDMINTFYREGMSKLFIQYIANYIIIVSSVKKPQQLIFMVDVFLFSVLHSSYHSIYQGGRIWSTLWLKGENNVGLLCAYAIPYAYFLYINYRDSVKKYFYLICMFASVTGVIVANSRGGFVATAVIGFFCWLFVVKKIRVLFLLLAVSLLVAQFAPDSFFTELKSLEQGTEEGTADERVYSWGIAIKMFIDHPVLGVGPFNYSEYLYQYDNEAEGRFGGVGRVAHSTQFQWLAECGIVGLYILIYFQLQLYRNWKIIYHLKIPDETNRLKDAVFLKTMTHANLITQIGFWVAAMFISIIHYPFYWLLPAFSEVWKNIYIDYVNEKSEAQSDGSRLKVPNRPTLKNRPDY